MLPWWIFCSYCLSLSAKVESAQSFIPESNPQDNEVVYIHPGNLADEAYRRMTFCNLPVCFISSRIAQLAFVGFFYTGYRDRCQCFSCFNIVQDWTQSDDVTSCEWHLDDCQMLYHQDPHNIPLMQAFSSARNMFSRLIFSSATQERFVRGLNLRNESQRLLSFIAWPLNAIISQFDLARLGFAYLGHGLSVFCFTCYGVISDWNRGKSIQEAHQRLYPHCDMANGFEFSNIPLPSDERQSLIESPSRSNLMPPCSAHHPTFDQQSQFERNPLLTLDNAMQSEPVRFALNLGFDYFLVRRLVGTRLHSGLLYALSEELINDLLEAD